MLDVKPRFYDALEGIATIYEICGQYKKAPDTWGRVKENLKDEWSVIEGALIERVECEEKRIWGLIQQ